MNLDLAQAVRLGLVQGVLALVVYFFFFRSEKVIRTTVNQNWAFEPIYVFRQVPGNFILRGGLLSVFAVVVFGPLLSVVFGRWGVAVDRPELLSAILRSLILGLSVGAIATCAAWTLAGFERHSRHRLKWMARYLTQLPLSFSGILLTLALMLAYPDLVVGHRNWLAVIAVQSVMAIPLVYRPISEGLSRLSPTLLDSAASLGASPWQRLRWVEFPLVMKSLGLGFLFAVAFSLGEVGSVLMLMPEGTPPLSLLIYRLMGQYRFAEADFAALTLLSLMVFLYGIMGKVDK